VIEKVLLWLVIQAAPASDTAHLEGLRLVVQPLGISYLAAHR
jgi:hypothetical protein